MSLTTEDLYKNTNHMEKIKNQTYEKIYNRCINSIKMIAKTGDQICLFEIPSILLGSSFPIVNREACSKYIIDKLSKTSKYIKSIFVEPNIIIIDWRK